MQNTNNHNHRDTNSNDISELEQSYRLRILACINQATHILKHGKSFQESLSEVCSVVPKACRFQDDAMCRIQFDDFEYNSPGFKQTGWVIMQPFQTSDGRKGSIEIYYSSRHPEAGIGPFSNDEAMLLDSLSQMISGYINSIISQEDKQFTLERLKELAAINQTTNLIKAGKPVGETLRSIALLIPAAWQFPENTCARITFDTSLFTSNNFTESEWRIASDFETIDGKAGRIEVFYTREYPELFEGPFLREERDLIDNLAGILTGYLNSVKGKEEKLFSTERLKELSAINQTTLILREKRPVDETLEQMAGILPAAWQFPQYCSARIVFDDKQYTSHNFMESPWFMLHEFEIIDGKKGSIEIFYSRQLPNADEGPFLKEERQLIANLASLITGYLNSIKGHDVLKKSGEFNRKSTKSFINSRQLLQKFINKNNYQRDIFHDLMPFKVREVLLLATLYDAYSIEKEGRFSEHILGEYYHLNLSSVPRITGVSTIEEALEQLEAKHYDLIILMVGMDKAVHFAISERIRQAYPYIPIYVLLNNNADIHYFEKEGKKPESVDKVFVWNGDSKIFFAMVKQLEDRVNVENDTSIGLVRVILLVEDSAKYYSRYLPLLYSIVLEQTSRLIEDVNTDELYKVLKLRARPKILLASDYEEAISVFNKYKENMLCLITDVRFRRNGVMNDRAGFSLVEEVREQMRDLPIIIQSSDRENAHQAFLLKGSFINKNADSLVQDIKYFISTYLGFGSFVYKDSNGRPIATARTLREFEKLLRNIPDDSLLYHAKRNHFSLWFMARGEVQIARIIYPFKLEHFESAGDIRNFLLDAIQQHRNEQNKGKVIPFEESLINDDSTILTLSSGSLGGKGRGLAFINTLIFDFDFHQIIPNINIRAPKTFIIGTDEFEAFIDRNNLHEKIHQNEDEAELKTLFLEAKLSDVLTGRLRKILNVVTKPLAVRSSGLFEDSLMQPFAGIFETFLVPNNHPEPSERLKQCSDAIKLVFASTYSKIARSYIEAIDYKIEEERMAVVLQEVVGNTYGDYFYPHISGVAQSYNYYPFAHMKPEEGFSVLALGLGRYVVEGEKAFRFAPTYPNLEINSPRDQFKSSQVDFYAVNLGKPDIDLRGKGEEAGLIKLDMYEAEKHGTIKHLASVYNPDNNTIMPGLSKPGPRILNFADILKYNYIPLARTIEVVLDVVKEAMGSPVEIEFAVDLNRDNEHRATFYLLQIKPLIGNPQDYTVDLESLQHDHLLLLTEKAMGNGLIDDLCDLIYVEPSTFDKGMTMEMVEEIEVLNQKMKKEKRKYILIGPGRWGTRDRFIGIPVNWPQISNAQIIVETSLEDFPLDASSGSHFFHNVTSMNVGYFSIQHYTEKNFINWDKLENQNIIERTRYFKHIRFEKPVHVKMDGRNRLAAILINQT